MFAWDDLAVLLALYRERATTRAAKVLGRSQPTVVRRIAALEQALGIVLFVRRNDGLEPTPAAETLVAHAEAAERAICAFASEADSLTGTAGSLIRLTFLDQYERLIVPLMRQFRHDWPHVTIQLMASDRLYDIARGEADLGIRGRQRPDNDAVLVRNLPPAGFAVYGSASLPREALPRRPGDLADHVVAGLEGHIGTLPPYRWLERHAGPRGIAMRCSGYGSLRSTIASGAAVSMLPCAIGEADAELVACFPPVAEVDIPLFLVGNRIALRRAHTRDLFERLEALFCNNAALLTGNRS